MSRQTALSIKLVARNHKCLGYYVLFQGKITNSVIRESSGDNVMGANDPEVKLRCNSGDGRNRWNEREDGRQEADVDNVATLVDRGI